MSFKRTTSAFRIAAAFTAALSLAIVSPLAPVAAYAETSAELKSQLEAAQNKLDELQKVYDQANAELAKTQWDLDQTNQKIDETEAKIAENEEELSEARLELADVASSSYKNGSGSNDLLKLVLSSSDFDSFISNLFYANKIARQRSDAIAEVQRLQTELENDKQELQEQQELQEELVADSKAKQQAAEEAAAEQASYVEGLSEEVQKALEEERQRAAEEALKKAQEEIKKEEENQANSGSNNSNNGGGNSNNGSTGGNNGSNNNNSGNSSGGSTGGGSSNATPSMRQTAVSAALSQVGKPYGHSNNGANWDCNGLTSWAWAQAGVTIPAASGTYGYGQFQWLKSSGRWVTSQSQLQLGDLVFYSYDGGSTTYHVAMYIGGGQVVHANGYRWGVHTSSLYFDYGFVGGGSPV